MPFALIAILFLLGVELVANIEAIANAPHHSSDSLRGQFFINLPPGFLEWTRL